jgi:D-alanyl-D-alanine-carboxypeptidase/D-alanyl-D-alanine-endopeptidase
MDDHDAAREPAAHPAEGGGPAGRFSYLAFAPTRGVGAFVAISQFNFADAQKMSTVANDLIATLAPR